MSDRIAVIVPYFGAFPGYWPVTLATMARNPQIHWHLFTDQEVPGAPANVIVHRTHFAGVAARIEATVGYPIALTNPYKLCDFRPAYGHVFAEELRGYDYWGFGDLDVVFGDLWRHIGDAVRRGDERILTFGHLSLYRNTDRTRLLYLEGAPGVPSARQVFTDPAHYSYDEFGGWRDLADFAGLTTFAERAFFDIYVDAYRPQANRSRRVRNDTVFAWQDGRCLELDRTGRIVSEAAYLHLQKRAVRPLAFSTMPSTLAIGPVDIMEAHDLADAARVSRELERSLSSRLHWLRHNVRFRAARARKRISRELDRRLARGQHATPDTTAPRFSAPVDEPAR
jgi:hypothetical protein